MKIGFGVSYEWQCDKKTALLGEIKLTEMAFRLRIDRYLPALMAEFSKVRGTYLCTPVKPCRSIELGLYPGSQRAKDIHVP